MATTKITPAPLTRTIAEVAHEVAADWPKVREVGTPGPFGNVGQHPANPYWSAMQSLPTTDLSATYGYDRASEVVRYFLENTQGWRGETAKRVKAELRAALALHDQRARAARGR